MLTQVSSKSVIVLFLVFLGHPEGVARALALVRQGGPQTDIKGIFVKVPTSMCQKI